MILSLGTTECNCVCVWGGSFATGTSPFTKKCYCRTAQQLRHIGGRFRRAKTREEGAPVSCLRTGGQIRVSTILPSKWASICSVEGRVGVEIRPGLYVGREAMRQKQVPATAPCPRASLTSTIPCRKRQTAVPLGSLVPRLREKVGRRGWGVGETNQAVIVSKWWGLKDCRSLSESLSVWTLGYPLTEKSLQPSHERSPASLEDLPMPDPGLEALQGKGHHDSRQC